MLHVNSIAQEVLQTVQQKPKDLRPQKSFDPGSQRTYVTEKEANLLQHGKCDHGNQNFWPSQSDGNCEI